MDYLIDGTIANAELGHTVALSADGKRVAIGQKGVEATTPPMVTVYENDGNAWLPIGDPIIGEANNDPHGFSIALSADGQTMALGLAHHDALSENMGQLKVYTYVNESWSQMGSTILGTQEEDLLGYAVAISATGDRVAVGAPDYDHSEMEPDVGYTQIYEYDNGEWIQLGSDIIGDVPQEVSGRALSLSADGLHLAIGSPTYGIYISPGVPGAVRLFEYIQGEWQQKGNTIHSFAESAVMGSAVALSADGNRVALSAPVSMSGGHVYVFQYAQEDWQYIGGVTAAVNDYLYSTNFGTAIALSGDGHRLVVGNSIVDVDLNAPELGEGILYIYEYDGDTHWNEIGRIENEDQEERTYFGGAIGLSADGTQLAVGARAKDNDLAEDVGRVLIYSGVGTTSVQEVKALEHRNLILYPNPTQGPLFLAGEPIDYQAVQVTNHLGQLLQRQSTIDQVDLSGLPTGLYFIALLTEKEMLIQPVLKE
ncbi:MAG: T9SS type A sorting domain-containing protein [Bacteroidota bacterium]